MKKINIGIVAHVDAGKTTVTENLLYYSGVIKEVGRVDSGNTKTDSMELERKRGISIKSSPISFNWKDVKINIIDTPGHVDFISEVERSLSVLDGAILIVSAKEGIQAQTRILFESLKALKIPTIIFINKIDRIGAAYEKLLKELKTNLSDKIVRLQNAYEIGSKAAYLGELFEENEALEDIINVISKLDNELLEAYAGDIKISKIELENKVSFYAKKGLIYPVLCGSGLLGLGIENLLEGILRFLPKAEGNNQNRLSAVVFKIQRENFNEKKVYVRLYEGTIALRDTIEIENKNVVEKVKKIKVLEKGNLIEKTNISAGDIGVLYGLKDVQIGEVIGSPCNKIKNISIAKPTLKAKIWPVNKGNNSKLFEALTILAEEDPLLQLEKDDLENEIYINLFGAIQMEILKSMLEDFYDIKVEFSETMTIYKETPIGVGSARAFIYESSPFAAGVGIVVEPIKRGQGVKYESKVSYGSLSKPFQNAVEEAVLKTCKQGLLGWEVTDIKVTFDFSQYCSVNSTPSDFRNLVPMVLMEALNNAKTTLLEPYYEFELVVPKEVSGRALSELRKMRASVMESDIKGDDFAVKGLIPVDTSKNYNLKLASYTEGTGVFFTKFYGYKKDFLNLGKSRKKTMVDPLNKKMYLMYKLNAVKNGHV